MEFQQWMSLASFSINLVAVGYIVKLTRLFTQMEMKVDTMWSVFTRRYGTRVEQGKDIE